MVVSISWLCLHCSDNMYGSGDLYSDWLSVTIFLIVLRVADVYMPIRWYCPDIRGRTNSTNANSTAWGMLFQLFCLIDILCLFSCISVLSINVAFRRRDIWPMPADDNRSIHWQIECRIRQLHLNDIWDLWWVIVTSCISAAISFTFPENQYMSPLTTHIPRPTLS